MSSVPATDVFDYTTEVTTEFEQTSWWPAQRNTTGWIDTNGGGSPKLDQEQEGVSVTTMSFGTVLEAFAASLMCLVCIFGNILVLIVVQRSRRLQSTTNYFVISLAVVDLIMAMFCMPFLIGGIVAGEWVFGSFLCMFVRFLQYMKPGASVFVLVAISIDRFYTILYPLSFKITRGKAKKMIIISWSFGILISCPAFYFFSTVTLLGNHREVCQPFVSSEAAGIMFVTALLLVEYLLPLCVLVITYARVFRHIWTVGVGGRSLHRTMNSVPRAKVKTVKMLMIVSGVFFVSWLPFFVAQEWFVCAMSDSLAQSDLRIYSVTLWISLAACAWNPFIYSCYNPNFRRGCKEVLCISTMKCYRKDTYAITNASKLARKNHVGVLPDVLDTGRSFTTYRAFDRDANGDKKMAWPLPTNSSTTYL
ncbi:probable G-protein coupled receptor 19 [Diadema antillarum]|uniref:probable G-protein coupled receptor 19 n=1 Tax=Diadema antillarum TaxID=105358 RepID=UPI003A8692C5